MRAQEFILEDAPDDLVIKHKPTSTGGAAVEAYISNREVGFVQFQRLRDGNYKASMAHVSPTMRKQGIGREMYRYARNVLGFNIVPSDVQSDDAQAFWSRGGATNEGHRAIETVDVDAIHDAALREHLLSDPDLYEDRDDFQAMRTFLDTHKTPKPVVKKSYVYASVQTTPVSKYASLAHFDNRHRLVDIDEQYAYFDINGSIKRFPESGKLSGDSMSQIYFFNSAAELAQFNTLLQLKFSDYKFTSKTLDHSGVEENFADGKVRGKSRPGRVKRAGASCTGSVTSLRKRAKAASGERAKMYHWCANMKSGKRK